MFMIKRILLSVIPVSIMVVVVSCSGGTSLKQKPEDLTVYVDPLIGTAHCRWFHVAPGACPFGMAKPGPSTDGHLGNLSGWEAVGYDFRHSSIEGFPNFHEFQIGGVVFMPTRGRLLTVPGSLDSVSSGYRSSFDKKDEVMNAGYYSVLLKDYGIKAEVTSTDRVSFHRYTFPEGKESHILFDIGNKQGESGSVKDALVRLTADGHIEGFVETQPEYVKKYQSGSSVKMFFSAVTDKRPESYGIFHHARVEPDKNEASGEGAGLYLTFSTAENESIVIKAGLSYTSVENARLNLGTEARDLGFEDARKQAHDKWESLLGRIRVEGKDSSDKIKFYTGLYHALLGRGLASDVNGAYPRHDGSAGQIPLSDNHVPAYKFYNTDAIWGGQWNLIQLWALVYPEYLSDFIKTQLTVYHDADWLGDGIACSRFVSGVGTNQVPLAIVAAYMCGIRDFNVVEGYEASLKNETDSENRPFGAGKADVGQFVRYGYVPYIKHMDLPDERWKFSCSHTLEYSYTSFAVAQMAKALGRDDDYNLLERLSGGWEKIYDPQKKLMWPKLADGEFYLQFDPSIPHDGFQEGNAYQYTFYVPHDPEGIAAKMGVEEFNSRLDSIFIISRNDLFGGGKEINAFAGIMKPYNHGNQPCLHTSFLFNHTGAPSLTQKWVRSICRNFYGTEGIHGYGFGQDEDQGQLGAWFVMAGIGLFDVAGLTKPDPEFGISSPLFDKITISLNEKYFPGKQFIIKTANNNEANLYIRSMRLNGNDLKRTFIPFSTVVKGGEMTMEMGPDPVNKY